MVKWQLHLQLGALLVEIHTSQALKIPKFAEVNQKPIVTMLLLRSETSRSLNGGIMKTRMQIPIQLQSLTQHLSLIQLPSPIQLLSLTQRLSLIQLPSLSQSTMSETAGLSVLTAQN